MKKKLMFFGGPMNKDTSEQYMENGQKLHVDNMRFTDKGGAAQDIIGNSEVVNAGLPAGLNVCSHAHAQGDFIFYFIWNSNEDHQIWQHRYDTGLFELILQDTLINPFIGGQTSVRHIGDLLYWTDGFFTGTGYGLQSNGNLSYSGPRKLNLAKSRNYQTSGGTDPEGYPSMDLQTMDLIKYPPASKPVTEYQTDSTRKSNELYQKLLQFTYRYVYDDNETSVWSQYSKIIIPNNTESLDGRRYTDPEADNNIQITIDTGHHTVSKIQIASRLGNFGNFGIFRTIDKDVEGLSDDAAHDVNFYGDESVEVVDNQTLRNYDTVPQTANMLEAVNGNTLVLANMIEGFDKVDLDATIIPTYRTINAISDFVMEMVMRTIWSVKNDDPPIQDMANNYWYEWVPDDQWFHTETQQFYIGFLSFIIIDPNNLPTDGTVIHIPYRTIVNGAVQYESFYYVAVEADSDADTFGQNLASFLDNLVTWDAEFVEYNSPDYADEIFSPNGYNYVVMGVQYYNYEDDFTWTSINGSPVIDPTTLDVNTPHYEYIQDVDNISSVASSKERCWKWGTHHPIGIVYTDRSKRDGTVNTEDGIRAYVPFPAEVDLPSEGVLGNTPYINVLKFSIDHQAPEWAVKYHFVYQANSRILNFQHRMVRKAEIFNDNRVMFSLEDHYQDTYIGSDVTHQAQKGDIVRILSKAVDPDNLYPIDFQENYYEFNVLEYLPDGGENGGEAIVIEVFDFSTVLDGFEAFVVEIYTPRDSAEEALWFELGEDYDIIDPHTPNRVHQGSGAKFVEVISIDVSAGEIVLVGDYGYLSLNGTATVSSSPNGNDGDYIVSSSSYDVDTNETTITLTTSLPGTDDVVDTGVLCTVRQDQNVAGTAEAGGYLEEGDCYYRVRPQGTGFSLAVNAVVAWVQEFSFSDYYTSNWYNKGRPMIFDVNARQEYRTGLFRNSQKFLDNTLINGLSTFYGLDQAQVQENFGALFGIVQVGQTLKYFQANKIGSIYIGQDEITNADGSKQLITSNKVLGTIRPHEEPYGSRDYLSILKVDRDVYFYDREKSVFGKVTPGGIVDLSALGMNTWFRDKTDDFVTDTKVMCVHDRRNNEVLVVFTTRAELVAYSGRTALGFNYQKNEFTGFQSSLGVEMMVGYEDDRLFSWKNGLMYRHDDGDVREFYGVKVSADMTFVFNEGPDRIKTMKGIGMNSNRGVILEEVEVLPSTAYPNGMMSRIKKESFKAKEGGLFADYRRDMNDPNFTNDDLAVVAGRELRGYLVKHKVVISEDTTERVTLQNVTIYYYESGN